FLACCSPGPRGDIEHRACSHCLFEIAANLSSIVHCGNALPSFRARAGGDIEHGLGRDRLLSITPDLGATQFQGYGGCDRQPGQSRECYRCLHESHTSVLSLRVIPTRSWFLPSRRSSTLLC